MQAEQDLIYQIFILFIPPVPEQQEDEAWGIRAAFALQIQSKINGK